PRDTETDPVVGRRLAAGAVRSVVRARQVDGAAGPDHLAQTELALGNRARMALSTSPYTAQAMNQDQWMTRDEALSGREAIDAFAAIAAMNRSMFQALSAAD